jgi:hypothetical protein
MNTALKTNLATASWDAPQMIALTNAEIQVTDQGAYAATLNADEHFADQQIPFIGPVKKIMQVVPVETIKPARISSVRVALFSVLMILLLPLFLIIGRSEN